MTSDPRLPSAPLGTHLTRYLHIAKHGLAGGQLSSCPRGQVEQRHGPLAPRAILIGPTDESTNYGCDLRAVLVLVPGSKSDAPARAPRHAKAKLSVLPL